MIEAVGTETRKVYEEANSKRDLLRQLNKKYPFKYVDKVPGVYPEPLFIRLKQEPTSAGTEVSH